MRIESVSALARLLHLMWHHSSRLPGRSLVEPPIGKFAEDPCVRLSSLRPIAIPSLAEAMAERTADYLDTQSVEFSHCKRDPLIHRSAIHIPAR